MKKVFKVSVELVYQGSGDTTVEVDSEGEAEQITKETWFPSISPSLWEL